MRRQTVIAAVLGAVIVTSGVGTVLSGGIGNAGSPGDRVAFAPRPTGPLTPGGYGAAPGGMMGSYGPGPGGMGGMMHGWSSGVAAGQVITIDQAQQGFQQYLDQLGTPDLALDEVMEFQDNFYAIVKETSTGRGAFELLANKYTGGVIPEPGPNMMWSTKYGMMANQQTGGQMSVTADQAKQIGQRWLDQQQPGSTTEMPDQFYGYYTVHNLKDGKVTGMLSVNGYSGQVWYHTWHGPFVGLKDLLH